MFYVPAVCLVKIFITLFNRRITGLTSRIWRNINGVLFCIIVFYMIGYELYLALRCPGRRQSPLQIGKRELDVSCPVYQSKRLSLFAGSFQVILDFCLLSTPIIVLWKIKMSWSKKVRPLIIFLLGSISCLGALMIPITQYQSIIDPSCT